MPIQTVADLGERALIERIRARTDRPAWVVIGPGDDAAVVKPARGTLDVSTVDAQVEGVHFDTRFVPPEAVGHRALAVNLSDLAAMGAEPRAALLSLVLPPSVQIDWFDRFLDGFFRLAAAHRVTLIGGNITSTTGPIVADVTALGSVRPRRILARSGARPGDTVYVTGSLGSAAVGLRMLRDAVQPREVLETDDRASAWSAGPERYLQPEPRVRAGLLLGRNRAASSCMDLSDGLADGLRQIAAASAVGIEIDASMVPVAADARRWLELNGNDWLEVALAGGDDYELLFTVRASQRGRLRLVRQQMGDLPITKIGVVTKAAALLVRTADGVRPLPDGYEHYR